MSYCAAPLPENESERLHTLFAYDVLDTEPEPLFDELTRAAARICEAPIALISLVDDRRQWFKSRVGLDAAETSRQVAFCAHALLKREILEIPDTLCDPRFAGNPLVAGGPKIRFYAGAPLVAANGCAIGTLCVIDYIPRKLTEHQRESLTMLARAVVAELELEHSRQLATALKERNAAQILLRRTNERLEEKVAQRTATLTALNNALTSEIAARREAESKVRELATRDPLTGLPNRSLLMDRLQQQIALARRQHFLVAVLFVDLDGFKTVNDTYGHHAGDAMLIEIAQRLRPCVREGDVVARLGGDEFIVSLYGLASRRDAACIARKILAAVSQPCEFEGESLHITASIGVSVYPADADDSHSLARNADEAMYQAKAAGKNAFRYSAHVESR